MLMNFKHRQNGAALILVVLGMVVMLGMVGLALDGGHAMLNKTRLQNSVDAAALSGAKELDFAGDQAQARAAVILIFAANGAAPGNHEIGEAYADGTIDLQIQFSETLNPFVPGTIPAEYVRVRARNFEMPIWFSQIVGATQKTVSATAVAGPSPTIKKACNIAPMMVCGSPDAGPPFWGYTPDEPDVLKSDKVATEVGPGNFQLIRLDGGQGGAEVRLGMAGKYDGCISSDGLIETEPGNTVGPVGQGLNTRFGIYDGSMHSEQATYPPDVITQQPNPLLDCGVGADGKEDCSKITQGTEHVTTGEQLTYNHSDYNNALAAVADGVGSLDNAPPTGQYHRRVVAVPIGDCSGTTNGQGQVPLLGFGCYFLLQEVGKGSEGSKIFGQFIESCNSGGVPGAEPGDSPGPYIIQLYKDPGSPDS
jgi:hypothetical protein